MRNLLFIAALGGLLSSGTALAQAIDARRDQAPVRPVVAPGAVPGAAPASAGVLQLLREVDSLKREVQALRGQVENQGYELGQLRNQISAAGGQGTVPAIAGGAVAPLPTLTPPTDASVAGTPAPESALQVQTEATGMAPSPPPAAPAQPGSGDESAAAAGMGGTGQVAMPEQAPPAAPAAPAGTPELAPVPAPPPAAAGTDDATSEAAYRDAFSLLRSGDYDRAIAAFTDFQAQHPNSQYGDNAQYWLAEAYYAKGQYAPAIAEYQKMQSQYPASKKLSHAMLKTGYSYDKLGKAAEAGVTLRALIQQYPGSAAAKLAEERLAQIKGGKPR